MCSNLKTDKNDDLNSKILRIKRTWKVNCEEEVYQEKLREFAIYINVNINLCANLICNFVGLASFLYDITQYCYFPTNITTCLGEIIYNGLIDINTLKDNPYNKSEKCLVNFHMESASKVEDVMTHLKKESEKIARFNFIK